MIEVFYAFFYYFSDLLLELSAVGMVAILIFSLIRIIID
jgi:hypothetical protein